MPFDGDPREYSGGGGDGAPAPMSFIPYLAEFMIFMSLVFGKVVAELIEGEWGDALLDSFILFLLVLLISIIRSKPSD
jgi:hypothetical protein